MVFHGIFRNSGVVLYLWHRRITDLVYRHVLNEQVFLKSHSLPGKRGNKENFKGLTCEEMTYLDNCPWVRMNGAWPAGVQWPAGEPHHKLLPLPFRFYSFRKRKERNYAIILSAEFISNPFHCISKIWWQVHTCPGPLSFPEILWMSCTHLFSQSLNLVP